MFDAFIFFYGNGFKCYYYENAIANSDFTKIKNIIYHDTFKILETFCDIYDLSWVVKYGNFNSKNDLLDFLIARIEKNHFPILEINPSYLNYFPSMNSMPRSDQRHAITLIKYSGNIFNISDCLIPNSFYDNFFNGSIKSRELKNSWKASGYLYFDFSYDKIKNIDINEILTNFHDIVMLNINEYIMEEKNPISLLIEDLNDSLKEVHVNFNMLCTKLSFDIRYSGLLYSRIYLRKALKYLNYENTDSIDIIIKNWRIFCLQLIKLGIKETDSELKKLCCFVRQILVEEKDFFRKLLLFFKGSKNV